MSIDKSMRVRVQTAIFAFTLLCLVPWSAALAAGCRNESCKDVRIIDLQVLDGGDLAATNRQPTVDVIRGVCDDESLEPFFDTALRMTVTNESLQEVRIRRATFRISRSDGRGAEFKSQKIALSGFSRISAGNTESLIALFLDAESGRKILPGSELALAADTGFRTLRVRMVGRNSLGKRIRMRARLTVSFDNFERC